MSRTLRRSIVWIFTTFAVVSGCGQSSDSPLPKGDPERLLRIDLEQRQFTGGTDQLTVAFGSPACTGSSSARPSTATMPIVLSPALCDELRRVFEPGAAIASLRSVPSCGGTSDASLTIQTDRTITHGEIGACIGATTEPYLTYHRTLMRARDEVTK